MGKGRRLGGPTAVAAAIWIVIRNILRESWILVEEVPGFPVSFLMRYLGDYYSMCTTVISNTLFGVPARRLRRYTLLVLKSAFILLKPVSDISMWAREKDDNFTWRAFMVAEDEEIRAELLWARRRRDMLAHIPPVEISSGKPTRDDCIHSLLETEKVRLNDFIAHHSVEDCVCSLGQDPNYCRAASGSKLLHTLVRNPGFLWVNELDRWMTVRESLLAQCFPITNECLQWCCEGLSGPPRMMTSFNRLRLENHLPPRLRSEVMHQGGNTMNTVVVGSVLMHLFLNLRTAINSLPNQPSQIVVSTSSSMLDMWDAARGDNMLVLQDDSSDSGRCTVRSTSATPGARKRKSKIDNLYVLNSSSKNVAASSSAKYQRLATQGRLSWSSVSDATSATSAVAAVASHSGAPIAPIVLVSGALTRLASSPSVASQSSSASSSALSLSRSWLASSPSGPGPPGPKRPRQDDRMFDLFMQAKG